MAHGMMPMLVPFGPPERPGAAVLKTLELPIPRKVNVPCSTRFSALVLTRIAAEPGENVTVEKPALLSAPMVSALAVALAERSAKMNSPLRSATGVVSPMRFVAPVLAASMRKCAPPFT